MVEQGNFGVEEMEILLREAFAPWVQQLAISPQAVTETGARFTIPHNEDFSREGGIVCGQALSAIADTVGVLALAAHNNAYRQMTTVDMTTHFMRPVIGTSMEATVSILSNGRRMATVRVDIRQTGKPKICAGATCAYAYLD